MGQRHAALLALIGHAVAFEPSSSAAVLQQEMPPDLTEAMRVSPVVGSGGRPAMAGEYPTDPTEGMTAAPLYNTSTHGLADLIEVLAEGAEGGEHFKIRMQVDFRLCNCSACSVCTVDFLLWLPAGFSEATAPWPVVFHLHGRGESSTLGLNEVGNLVRHGLPHRIRDRKHFKDRFVLVSPQLQGLPGATVLPQWRDFLPRADALREALFASSRLFDRERAFVTGLSVGASAVWSWALENPAGVQPWAGIIPASAEWPDFVNMTDGTPFDVVAEPQLLRLSRMNIFISHCQNDATMPIYVGARGRPRCTSCFADPLPSATEVTFEPPKCGVGADAIVEALEDLGLGEPQLTYNRIQYCHSSYEPTDSSFVPMYRCSSTDVGHDSWTRLYASRRLVDWMLHRRLAPQHRWW